MCLKLAISKHKKGVNRYGWDIFMLVRQTTCMLTVMVGTYSCWYAKQHAKNGRENLN